MKEYISFKIDCHTHNVVKQNFYLDNDLDICEVYKLGENQRFYIIMGLYDKSKYMTLCNIVGKQYVYLYGKLVYCTMNNCRIVTDEDKLVKGISLDKLNEKYGDEIRSYFIKHETMSNEYRKIQDLINQRAIIPDNDKELYEKLTHCTTDELNKQLKTVEKNHISYIIKPIKISGNEDGVCVDCAWLDLDHKSYKITQYNIWQIYNTYFEDYLDNSDEIKELFKKHKNEIFNL